MNETLVNVQTEYYRQFLIRYGILANNYTGNTRGEIFATVTEYVEPGVGNIFLRRCMTRVTGQYFRGVNQAREFIDECYRARGRNIAG